METLQDEAIRVEAEYALERALRCAHCQATIETLNVVRLLRGRVNFTSALPRRGYAVVCPRCDAIVAAGLGSTIGI